MHVLLSVKLPLMIQAQFGQKIKEQRKQAAMTQEALSIQSGVTFRYLQDIEAGKKQPTITTVFKLAQALKVAPGELLDDIFKSWSKTQKVSKNN